MLNNRFYWLVCLTKSKTAQERDTSTTLLLVYKIYMWMDSGLIIFCPILWRQEKVCGGLTSPVLELSALIPHFSIPVHFPHHYSSSDVKGVWIFQIQANIIISQHERPSEKVTWQYNYNQKRMFSSFIQGGGLFLLSRDEIYFFYP